MITKIFIKEPPGCGKTFTLAMCAILLILENKRALIISHINVATDDICEKKLIFIPRKILKEKILHHFSSIVPFENVRSINLLLICFYSFIRLV